MIYIKTLKSNISDKGLDNIIKKLKSMKSGLENSNSKIVQDMGNFVKEEVEKNLTATIYKDGNEKSEAYLEINKNKAKAGMKGVQSLYNEFGTGTKGQESPHPQKGEFGLHAYNSGKTIRISKSNGEMYWTYKNSSGEIVKTTGIPAGKQVFNASIMLRGRKHQIIKKRVGEVISKL